MTFSSPYRDIIHGSIEISADLESFVRRWYPLKRLEGISQLGFAQLVYRDARHSRFDHCIGTIGAVKRIFDVGRKKNAQWVNQLNQAEVELLACVHDVGHGPYSHVAEMILRRNPNWCPGGITSHETFTELMIGSQKAWKRIIPQMIPGINVEGKTIRAILKKVQQENNILAFVAKNAFELLEFQQYSQALAFAANPVGESFGENEYGLPNSAAYSIISNQFDVDRLDYMLRDGYHTKLITIDIISKIWENFVEGIIPSQMLYNIPGRGPDTYPGVVFKDTLIDTLELFLWVRQNHFRNIAFHPVTRLAEQIWVHVSEKHLDKIEKQEGREAVQERLLKWFVESSDDDIEKELEEYPGIDDIKGLSEISYSDLVDPQRTNYGDWIPIAYPFWGLHPKERISLLYALGDKGAGPTSVKLEQEIFRNLELDEEHEYGQAFIDFAIPPVYIPDSIIHVSQTDHTPWTFARNRSAALAALALSPFKEGQIVFYLRNNVNKNFQRPQIRQTVINALDIVCDNPGKLSRLSRTAAITLRSSQARTVAELSADSNFRNHYSNSLFLHGIKEAGIKELGKDFQSGYCIKLAEDLEKKVPDKKRLDFFFHCCIIFP